MTKKKLLTYYKILFLLIFVSVLGVIAYIFVFKKESEPKILNYQISNIDFNKANFVVFTDIESTLELEVINLKNNQSKIVNSSDDLILSESKIFDLNKDKLTNKILNKKTMHYFNLINLEAETDYKINIFVNNKLNEFEEINEIKFKTIKANREIFFPETIYGKVLDRENQKINEAFLINYYLSDFENIKFSVLTSNDGNWAIDLSKLKVLKENFKSEDIIFEILNKHFESEFKGNILIKLDKANEIFI